MKQWLGFDRADLDGIQVENGQLDFSSRFSYEDEHSLRWNYAPGGSLTWHCKLDKLGKTPTGNGIDSLNTQEKAPPMNKLLLPLAALLLAPLAALQSQAADAPTAKPQATATTNPDALKDTTIEGNLLPNPSFETAAGNDVSGWKSRAWPAMPTPNGASMRLAGRENNA